MCVLLLYYVLKLFSIFLLVTRLPTGSCMFFIKQRAFPFPGLFWPYYPGKQRPTQSMTLLIELEFITLEVGHWNVTCLSPGELAVPVKNTQLVLAKMLTVASVGMVDNGWAGKCLLLICLHRDCFSQQLFFQSCYGRSEVGTASTESIRVLGMELSAASGLHLPWGMLCPWLRNVFPRVSDQVNNSKGPEPGTSVSIDSVWFLFFSF